MSLNRGRFIIGERPAPDVVQCMRCRRMWDATAQSGLQCVVCKINWEAAPEWDRSSVIKKVWVIESRWRIGFGYGHWQHVAQLPCDHSADDIEAIVERYRQIEKQRCKHSRQVMVFEFRVIDDLVVVYCGATPTAKQTGQPVAVGA